MSVQILHREIPGDLSALEAFPPLLQRIYASRSVTCEQEVQHELAHLLPYNSMLGIDAACERLFEAISNGQRIVVVGDFDADGATSTALAVDALRQFGSNEVSYWVPNRFTYGYGLTPAIVELAAKQLQPDLILTVDNGIASHDGVEKAKALGIDVLITDHHLPGKTLPNACAIVNPNQPDDAFPSKCLAGVGVIFYVMAALRAYMQQQDFFEQRHIRCPNMAQYTDLVALGTVVDVVPLDRNNRILVKHGLDRIRRGRLRPGIAALLQVAGKDYKRASVADLGFVIGPRLNSAGRLDDMTLGIACLLSPHINDALRQATVLNKLNYERRALESKMQREAYNIVDRLHINQELPMGLCLFQEDWHQGVVGLVASRIKDKIHRPVIAFAKTANDILKGSARSVPGLHIRDVLQRVSVTSPDLLTKFGGHAMAAGLSIHFDQYETFQRVFSEEVAKELSEKDIQGCITTDGTLAPEEFTLDTAELLQNSGPWGQHFPEPQFDGVFRVHDQYIVGQRHLKLVLQVPQTDIFLDGIKFNVDMKRWPNHQCEMVKLVYRLDVNEFRGRKQLQLLIQAILN